MKKMMHFFNHLKERIRLDRKAFIIYSVLRALVILTGVRCFINQNFEGVAICIFSLVLFLLPSFFEEKLKVEIPTLFEGIIYIFIFAAEILGEVNHYYTEIPGWDTMLHTINGFLCAAIGFSLVDVMNRKSPHLNLSPAYLAVVAFCFSMTVGVLWEFIEFTMDQFFYLDMQKDYIIQNIGSVTLDPTHSQIPVKVSDITETVIKTASGKTYTIKNGYLDIGLADTMKDLMVNFVGAVVFSIIGYFCIKNRDGKKERVIEKGARGLMLQTLTDQELQEQEKKIEERQAEIRAEREEIRSEREDRRKRGR